VHDAAGTGQKTGADAREFEQLAEVPPEEEWLANITNAKTRRAYKNDVREFIAYAGLQGLPGAALDRQGAYYRLARQHEQRQLSQPASGASSRAIVVVRLPLRPQRRGRQSRRRCQAADGQLATKAARRHSATAKRASC